MDDLQPFEVSGPVKFFKILSTKEKQVLLKHRIIQEHEVKAQIMSFHDENKRVIGYDIQQT